MELCGGGGSDGGISVDLCGGGDGGGISVDLCGGGGGGGISVDLCGGGCGISVELCGGVLCVELCGKKEWNCVVVVVE